MEIEEMIREEYELGNPFAEGSYRSYKAKNRITPAEKEEFLKEKNTIILTEKQILLRDKIHKTIEKRNELPF